MMRLHKFLAVSGVASRRRAEQLIAEGIVTVNGVPVTTLGTQINEDTDVITVQGKVVTLSYKRVYYALHKPDGYICSTIDQGATSVLRLVPPEPRVYPVGRLDKDSTGLLLISNDGDFTLRVTHARYGCEKEYFVVLDRELTQADCEKLKKGMKLGGKRLQSIQVVAVEKTSARLVLHEGVNREIRRVLGGLGYTIKKLKRIRIGKLELGSLQPGQWRAIRPTDVMK